MQEKYYIQKLELLKDKSVILAQFDGQSEKLAESIYNLSESLFGKVLENTQRVKSTLADHTQVLSKRGFNFAPIKKMSKETIDEKVAEVKNELKEILMEEGKGLHFIKTIFRNNGVHVVIDKTTLGKAKTIFNKL